MTLLFAYYRDVQSFVEEYFPKSVISTVLKSDVISEYKGVGKYYCNYFDIDINSVGEEEEFLLNEIVHENFKISSLRCRVLRDLSFKDRYDLFRKASLFWIRFFNAHDYKKVFSMCVDTFILDTLHLVCEKKGIEVVSYSKFFVKGYYRKTSKGEFVSSSNILDTDFKKMIMNQRKSFMIPSKKGAYKNAIKGWIKSKMKYFFFYIIQHKVLRKKEWKYQFSDFKRSFWKLPLKYGFRTIEDSKHLIGSKERNVAIYLHLIPEATTDYWSKDWTIIDYESKIETACLKLKERGYNLFVKEHPNMLFQRSKQFYSRLEKYGVKFINPFELNTKVFEYCESFLITTGSIGIESFLKKKTILLLDTPYYIDPCMKQDFINGIDKVVYSEESEKLMLNRLSKTLVC